MNTTRSRMEEPQRNRFFNLPFLLTIGAMILLGITTLTLGFLLRPEPRQWDEPAGTAGDAPGKSPGVQPYQDASPGPDTTTTVLPGQP